ncbi:hypothetical protein ThimaDRAFT_4633 [Thiocapsa marina 5811]|uniref:DNA 3'-5' helicase II n=2 Tax=Thiocapsa marina TaxID=244573 RepID=F9UI80_9GAMM|nr:hypothetical protein ThimaDRAFT_4633 [Thiocapsa marina 5811]
MATFYVYITDQCKDDAARHSVTKDIERLAEKIEEEQSDRGLDHYPPPYRKKVMGRPGRLVIEEHRVEDDTVLCFARYFTRGSSEYEAFYNNTESYYERNNVPHAEIDVFLKERKKTPIKKKPPLTEADLAYLQSSKAHHYTDDGAFLESYDWFDRISKGWAKDYLSRYYDLICQIENSLPSGIDKIVHEKNSDIQILFRCYPEHKRVFLVAPIDCRNEGDEQELREKYSDLLTGSSTEMEVLVRRSRRAYPTIITYDENIWILVEKSVEANLALSPEEESILESLMYPTNDGAKYPLFINGRPGSGKSTILQYLFADHLARFIELNQGAKANQAPLYLTYSTPLLEQARAAVDNILTCGARNIEDGNVLTTSAELEEILQTCFRNFREFLRSLLPPDIKEEFAHASYIDFGRFRKLWDEKRSKHPVKEVRSIGAELGWHAVRTFIKGMQHESGSVIDPDYYQIELARDVKSISDQTFERIYEHVWETWYEPLCREHGYWDDQDLARAVLTHAGDKLSHYPAVFCDEAQDFTTIELELIQQLSIYSEREVPSYLVKHVPFAFAGDPFQTLNPTGFNWNAMQSSFHDNIVQQLDPNGAAKLEFNFQELAFNYRSSEHIVKLANLVQLLRAVLLRLKGLRPQKSWTLKATVSPVWFRRDDVSCQATLREQEELVIIVPCQENGEFEYVENDRFLKSMAVQNGEITRNILSPARAKGLEYDRVLLYGFGDDAVQRLPSLLDHIDNPNKDAPAIERRLAWEYFLNQFYVAITRARKRLFVVDSGDALGRFWAFTEANNQKELLDLYDHSDDWSSEELGGLMKGDSLSWSDDRDDPLVLARQWQEQGRAQRDPYLLLLAKGNFERAGRPEEARLCEAEQYEFEGEFDKAAKLYTTLKQSDNACRCYWANKDTTSVMRMVEEFAEVAADPRFIAASAINRDRNTARQIDTVLTALQQVTPTPFPDMPGEIDAWRWFFTRIASKTGDAIEASDREKEVWRPYIDRLINTITRFELPLSTYPEIAKLLFLTGDRESALNYWNTHCLDQKPDPERDKWLVRARAETEPYPANIRSFHELGDHNAAIDQWVGTGRAIDNDTPVKLLLDCAISIGDIAAIRALFPANNDLAQVSAALSRIDEKAIRSLVGALPVAISHSLESHGDWGQLIAFVSNQSTPDRNLNSMIKESGIEWPAGVLEASAVRAMARSERLVRAVSKVQKEVSSFLKQHLVIDKDAVRDKQGSVKSILKLVDIAEAGAAFERAFRLTYALEFYEQFFVKSFLAYRVLQPTADQAEFAKRRWILCKRRLARMQEGSGKEKHDAEARELEREWNISVDQEPEYPALAPISELEVLVVGTPSDTNSITSDNEKQIAIVSPIESKASDKQQISATTTLKLGNHELAAKVLTRKKRIILTDVETEDQVTCGPTIVASDDLKIGSVKDTERSHTWQVTDWGIQCEIETMDDRSVIRFCFSDGDPILGFEFISEWK